MLDIVDIKKEDIGKKLSICGWIKNHRKQSNFGFIALSDGTSQNPLQVVYTKDLKDFLEIQKLHIGSSIKVCGTLVESQGSGQEFELSLENLELLGDCRQAFGSSVECLLIQRRSPNASLHPDFFHLL